MLITLPEIWIVIIDIVLWFIIHISVAYIGTILPAKFINPNYWIFRKRKWEKEGKLYENVFKIKKWKELLPDGSAMFKRGFRKKRLIKNNTEYYNQFIIEVCRAEAVHWIVIIFSPVFFIWNYWWAGVIMIVYAFVANLPCILVQRYNRIRLKSLLVHF